MASTPKKYLEHREAVNKRRSAASKVARDIGPIPPVHDQARRDACERNFRLFCETYFARRFYLPWSADHLKVIDRIQQVVLDGGLYAIAMPRGSGKTSLCEIGCLWAMIYGHHQFVVLVCADESAAKQILESLKEELDANDALAADFPEVCYPIRRLEGIYHRSRGQLSCGQRTRIRWTASEIALPVVAGSKASSAIIRTTGITGRMRGMTTTRPADGKTVRPSLCLLDDVSTDESSRSPSQSQTRLDIIHGAILNLAGPKKKISALATVTVINQGDLADELLDVRKHPDWAGVRCKLVYEWPTEKKLWDEYAEIRAECLATGEGLKSATQFYAQHRAKMDEGSVVGWPERYNDDELSALQHAFNLRLRDETSFNAEYQNEPSVLSGSTTELPSHEDLSTHVNGLERGTIPLAATKLVAYIDIQKKCLFYVVAAFADDFTGSVIEYGVWPDQKRNYFTLAEVQRTLGRAKPGAGLEGQIYNGLEKLTEQLVLPYKREDDTELHVSRILIDASWGDSTATVRQFCRENHKGLVLPAFGRGITADRKPMSEYNRVPGDRHGWNWMVTTSKAGRHLILDTNSWKTFLFNRLVIARGDKGSLTFFKAKPNGHKMLVDHLLAEYPVLTQGQGRKVNVWKTRAGRPDNHWLDCLVGACVAASEQGCMTVGHSPQQKPRRRHRPGLQVSW